MKNDYSIWGEKTSIAGEKIPVDLRYAIDEKPISYISPWQLDETESCKEYHINDYDWREIIYQMAIDYYKNNTKEDINTNQVIFNDDFELLIAEKNPQYSTGITGYE
jgi:hypothetical protein